MGNKTKKELLLEGMEQREVDKAQMYAKKEKQEYKEFRELLRKGIGTRSQKEFAAEAGISTVHLNRMLNNETINQPSKDTLERLSYLMRNITLNELLVSCGHIPVDIEEMALKVEKEIETGISEVKGSLQSSIPDFLDMLNTLYITVRDSIAKTDGREEKIDYIPDAELKIPVVLKWQFDNIYVETKFDIFYARTTGGKVIILNSTISNEDNIETEWEEDNVRGFLPYLTKKYHHSIFYKDISEEAGRENRTAGKRLFDAIFRDENRIETVKTGYGFYYNETPEGFKDFLNEHAPAFCTSPEKVALYQKMLLPDAEPDKIFEDYATDDLSVFGTSVVVAEILKAETGQDFTCYGVEAGENDACIMFSEEGCEKGNNIKKYIPMLYAYAKELKVPTFGLCYHKGYIKEDFSLQFDTEKYYLPFKK